MKAGGHDGSNRHDYFQGIGMRRERDMRREWREDERSI